MSYVLNIPWTVVRSFSCRVVPAHVGHVCKRTIPGRVTAHVGCEDLSCLNTVWSQEMHISVSPMRALFRILVWKMMMRCFLIHVSPYELLYVLLIWVVHCQYMCCTVHQHLCYLLITLQRVEIVPDLFHLFCTYTFAWLETVALTIPLFTIRAGYLERLRPWNNGRWPTAIVGHSQLSSKLEDVWRILIHPSCVLHSVIVT